MFLHIRVAVVDFVLNYVAFGDIFVVILSQRKKRPSVTKDISNWKAKLVKACRLSSMGRLIPEINQ